MNSSNVFKEYQCPDCGKRFDLEDLVWNLWLVCNEGKEPIYLGCPRCGSMKMEPASVAYKPVEEVLNDLLSKGREKHKESLPVCVV
jgi:DNA-directed RNA polymerase subunit RPC12/RpoP